MDIWFELYLGNNPPEIHFNPASHLENGKLNFSQHFPSPYCSFKRNAMEMAQLLRSHPDSAAISPVHRALDWIEYALKHADLTHLRSPLTSVPFRIVYSLDIVLAMAFTIIGFWVIVFKHMVYDKMLAQVRRQEPLSSAASEESSGGHLKILPDDTTAEGKQVMAVIAEVEEEDDVKEEVTEVVDKKNA